MLRVLLGIFLVAYVVVALVNYSLVQSFVGSVASNYLSREMGGTMRIGSMGCNPFYHLVLHDVEIISPTDDTICRAERITVRFDKFPVDKEGLVADYVMLKNTYFHLGIDAETGINMKYIFDYFSSGKESEPRKSAFVVLVNEMRLDNVTYRQDLKDRDPFGANRVTPWVNIKHTEYRELQGRFRNVRVGNGDVTCRIEHLSTTEKCGLHLNNLQTNVYVTKSGISATNMTLETDDSKLVGDVLMDFRDWKTMKYFMDSVFFTVSFEPGSYGGMRDASYWAKTLWGMDERVYISGTFHGPLSDFHADEVKIAFGEETTLDIDATLQGLPKIETTHIVADVHKLHTTYQDLAEVKHPNGDVMKAASIIKALNTIDLGLTFDGTIYDFNTDLNLSSAAGDVNGKVHLSMNPKQKMFVYDGRLHSNRFNVAILAKNEWVSRSGFDFTFFGNGIDPKEMETNLSGGLHELHFRDQIVLDDIPIEMVASSGTIDASININDAIIGQFVLNAGIDITDVTPEYSVDLDIKHFDVKRLGLWTDTNDTEAMAYANAIARYKTDGSGNTEGNVLLNDLRLRTTNHKYGIDTILLDLKEENYYKDIRLRSDLADGALKGYLDWSGIGQLTRKFIDDYVPSFTSSPSGGDSIKNYDKIANADFRMNLTWKDEDNLLTTVLPALHLATGTQLNLNYSFKNSFTPLLRTDSLRYGGLMVSGLWVRGTAIADQYQLTVVTEEVEAGSLLLCEDSKITLQSSNIKADAELEWRNSSLSIGNGNLHAVVDADPDALDISLLNSTIGLGGKEWTFYQVGDARLDAIGWWFDGLELYNQEQSLYFTAAHHGPESDSIKLTLENFDVAIINPFINLKDMSASGVADGSVSLMGLYDVPYLNADITIDGLAFNGQRFGKASLKSTWESEQKLLNVNLSAADDSTDKHYMSIDGNAYLDHEETLLNFEAMLNDVGLSMIEPFVSGFSSKTGGHLSAKIDVGGTVQSPELKGFVALDSASLMVSLLNVEYTITDTIRLEKNAIRMDSLVIKDPMGDSLVVMGEITHDALKDIALDLSVISDKLLCMNTTVQQSGQYYGTIVASIDPGSVVTGSLNDINVSILANTLEGSSLNIPISDKRQAQQGNNIYFLSDDDDYDLYYAFDYNMGVADSSSTGSTAEKRSITASDANASHFHLTITVNTTPDLEIELPISFSTFGADVKATGTGLMELAVESNKPFSIIGTYEIADGSTLTVDALGAISKEFKIGEGSSIDFPGSIENASFNIQAIYSQKVNLSSIIESNGSIESQKNINVQNIIMLNGRLQQPSLTFDIKLPDADETTQDQVFTIINRDNQADILLQTLNLLMFGRFYNPSVSTANVSTTTATDGGYGMLLSTLGSFVNDIVPSNVNLNLDYTAGNTQVNDQYSVDLNYARGNVYFESTFGLEVARDANSKINSNSITGDILVGYIINPNFHLYVFNRSNANDYIHSDLPYRQGVGLKFTRDFDNFGELFRRRK